VHDVTSVAARLRDHQSRDAAALLMNLDAAIHFEALFRFRRANTYLVAVVVDLRVAAFRGVSKPDEEVPGSL